MNVTANKRLTIRLISDNEVEETLKSVVGFAYSHSVNAMEVEFSDGYVTRYDMKNIDKLEIE